MSDDWKDRLTGERRELSDKLGKLNIFLASLDDDGAPNLLPIDIALLQIQAHHMTCYLETLQRRIDRANRSGG